MHRPTTYGVIDIMQVRPLNLQRILFLGREEEEDLDALYFSSGTHTHTHDYGAAHAHTIDLGVWAHLQTWMMPHLVVVLLPHAAAAATGAAAAEAACTAFPVPPSPVALHNRVSQA